MQDKKTEVIRQLQSLKNDAAQGFEDLKASAEKELVIDDHDLDTEALRTPRLHTRWLDLLSQSAIKTKQFQHMYKKLYLERWKYYSGTASDKYYTEYGVFHHKIQKSDMDMYLNADDILCEAKDLLEVYEQMVMFCEKSIKEISSRTFHIKSAIDWRRFTSGA